MSGQKIIDGHSETLKRAMAVAVLRVHIADTEKHLKKMRQHIKELTRKPAAGAA